MNMISLIAHIPDESAMLQCGARMARACLSNTTLFLYGNLGAGKTTLTRGFLHGMGHKAAVKSPTYTLVESYLFDNITVYHFDLYRIHDARELDYIGIQDYFVSNAICVIEWPEKGDGILPTPDLSCYIEYENIGRTLKINAHTQHGNSILERYRDEN